MIKPNELRIGNYVLATNGAGMYPAGIVEVEEVLSDGINRTHGDHTAYESEILEGIPLSTEIISQRVFSCFHSTYMKGVIYLYEGGEVPGKSGWAVGISGFWINDSMRIVGYVDFVHQFQNLYFALTREELPLKGSVLIKRRNHE